MKNRSNMAVLCVLCVATPLALGQDFTYTLPPPAWSAINTNTALYRLQLDRLAQNSRTDPQPRKTNSTPAAQTTSTRAAAIRGTTNRSSAIKDLAAAYPEAARGQAEILFRDLLRQYGQLEKKFDIPPRDLGGAIAALLAGSYMAYRGVDFPDEHFKPLVAQMQAMVASNTDFDAVPEADRQYTYDQLASLGMFMAATQIALQQRPNEAISTNMRIAAKGYLEQLLKADAQRVQITATGLSLK